MGFPYSVRGRRLAKRYLITIAADVAAGASPKFHDGVIDAPAMSACVLADSICPVPPNVNATSRVTPPLQTFPGVPCAKRTRATDPDFAVMGHEFVTPLVPVTASISVGVETEIIS